MNANEQSLLDRIDALVDEQLDGGEPETGYDFDDPDFPGCPHCNRDWHGLAITERIERMRLYGVFDVKYKYAEDDSPVLCPGSDFIGPWATPHQIKSMRHRRFLGTTPRTAPWIRYRSSRDEAAMEPARTAHNPRDLITHEMPDVLRYAIAARNGRESLLREILGRYVAALYPGGMWSLPPAPEELFDPEEWSGVPPIRVSWGEPAPVTHESRLNVVGRGAYPDLVAIDETHIRVSLPGGVVLAEIPEVPSTPQERALPRPSSTPPMWAVDPTRSRRRRNQ